MRTSIHEAAAAGDTRAVKALLEGGFLRRRADVNERDPNAFTPLHWAAMNGHTQTCALLLDRGADPDTRGRAGRTPLDMAVFYGHTDTADLLRSRSGVE